MVTTVVGLPTSRIFTRRHSESAPADEESLFSFRYAASTRPVRERFFGSSLSDGLRMTRRQRANSERWFRLHPAGQVCNALYGHDQSAGPPDDGTSSENGRGFRAEIQYLVSRLLRVLRRHPRRDCAGKANQGLLRSRKIALIESMNPSWRDLSENFLSSRRH
jgi:hypothetical protein